MAHPGSHNDITGSERERGRERKKTRWGSAFIGAKSGGPRVSIGLLFIGEFK